MAKKTKKSVKQGRPSSFRKLHQDKICEALAMGMTTKLSCAYAGVGLDCFYKWRERGMKASSGKMHDFVVAIEKAKAKAAHGWLGVIEEAAMGHPETKVRKKYERHPSTGRMRLVEKTVETKNVVSWQAAAWKLERIYPGEFGRIVRQFDIGQDDKLSPEQILEAIKASSKRLRGEEEE